MEELLGLVQNPVGECNCNRDFATTIRLQRRLGKAASRRKQINGLDNGLLLGALLQKICGEPPPSQIYLSTAVGVSALATEAGVGACSKLQG
jgi:hypothetical protein